MNRPSVDGGPPAPERLAHPEQAEDDRRLGRALHAAMIVTLAFSVAGALISGQAGSAIATAAVVLVIAAPLFRVGWLIVRWLREGDTRFAVVGFGLLAIVAVGFVLSLLRNG